MNRPIGLFYATESGQQVKPTKNGRGNSLIVVPNILKECTKGALHKKMQPTKNKSAPPYRRCMCSNIMSCRL